MELRTLRYFLAVAREGSITAAADACHVTQPSLSRQIAQLEAELGTPLLERGRHGARLTPAGVLLRARAQTLVELASKTEGEVRSMTGELCGRVHVSCGDLAALGTLATLLLAFRKEHSQVSMALTIATASQARDRMAAGLDDLGVLLGEVDHMRYESVLLPEPERWAALVRTDDDLAGRTAITPADLVGRDLIAPPVLDEGSALARWFGNAFRELHVVATSTLNAGGAELVRAGVGIALVVPGSLAHAPADLAVVPLDPPLAMPASLVWLRGAILSDAANAFVSFAGEHVSCVRG